jgi:hypothetical protein
MKPESQNFLNLVLRATDTDPSIMTIDIAANEKKAAERRATMEKLNPPAKIAPKVEYNRLVSQLYILRENAKACEVNVNNIAGEVRLLEERITALLQEKKRHAEAGNLRGERTYEHQVELLEDDLAVAQTRLQGARSQNTGAARALKAFDGHQRLAELKKELGKG